MTDKLPDYESLENAFKPAKEILESGALPDSTELRSAQRHLDQAWRYTKESRERAKHDPDPEE
jgi:hypothetical protein